MSQYNTNQIKVLKDGGAIFASAIETEEVKLDNFQSAKVVISTGAGEAKTTTAKVVAILPGGNEQDIKEQEITIGNDTETIINVVANELAHYDATGFKVKVDAVASSEIVGTIVVALSEPRYSE